MSTEQVVVEVTGRPLSGKGPARKLRKEGQIPGVLYGQSKEPRPLALNPELLRRALKTKHGLNTVLTLKFDGGKDNRTAILKDWQSEATTSRLVHVDFVEVAMDKVMRVSVPLHFTGKSKGVIDGGILETMRHELVVDVLPSAIPTSIDVDVTELGVANTLHVEDLKLPEGVRAVYAQNFAIVTVVSPREEKVETPVVVAGAEGAAAAPGAAPAAADGKAPAADGKAAAAPAKGGAAPAAAAKPAAKK